MGVAVSAAWRESWVMEATSSEEMEGEEGGADGEVVVMERRRASSRGVGLKIVAVVRAEPRICALNFDDEKGLELNFFLRRPRRLERADLIREHGQSELGVGKFSSLCLRHRQIIMGHHLAILR